MQKRGQEMSVQENMQEMSVQRRRVCRRRVCSVKPGGQVVNMQVKRHRSCLYCFCFYSKMVQLSIHSSSVLFQVVIR